MHRLAAILALSLLAACQDRTLPIAARDGVRVDEVTIGEGLEATEGRFVEVTYTVALPDGRVVVDLPGDESSHRFVVGDGTVIPGLDEAVRGMREGGERTVRISWKSGYGSPGLPGVIPPRTSLLMELKLLDVRTSPAGVWQATVGR
ncbi:MAG: FKBP-type peptidyl-prolyl cis-trans isomerase [Planctomycetota bacterium]